MNSRKSSRAFQRAKRVLVGGVNSPVRAYSAVGGNPPFIARAKGAYITDIDGNRYIDYVGTWGPAILGHAYAPAIGAIARAAAKGTSFGAPTESEALLAEEIIAAMPSIQKVRFVSSGTEAVMTAVRLARGATGRCKIIKFAGCYHGHSDPLLVSAGSGAMTLGVPSSPGVPEGATRDTVLAGYNDLPAVEAILRRFRGQIAAILVEPVVGNMGVVRPEPGFLPGLRDLCSLHGTMLIFDEVMTGFRLARGGAQEIYGVRPDLTTLGKIIGGGMPVGAVGGPARIMDHLAPLGPVYQAGTLSGNPVAMAAGLATLQGLRKPQVYKRLEERSAALADGLLAGAARAGLEGKVTLNRQGSMLSLFFTPPPVRDYAGAAACNTRAFAAFFQTMRRGGVYLPPSQFEAWFVSAAHSQADIDRTVAVAGGALAIARKVM